MAHFPAREIASVMLALVTAGDTVPNLSYSQLPPPPPPPADTTVLFQETFQDTSFAGRGWYDMMNGSVGPIVADNGVAGGHALVVHFAQGATAPVRARHLFSPTTSVYLRYWARYSADWIGSGKPYHPHEMHFVTNEDNKYVGPSWTHLTLYVEHWYGPDGGYPQLAAQDGANIDTLHIGVDLTGVTEQRAVSGCNGVTDGAVPDCYKNNGVYFNDKHWRADAPAFLPGPGPDDKTHWHEVEAYFQLNSVKDGKGQPDGVAQYWFDGTLVIDRHDAMFRTGAHPDMEFDQFIIAPYIGDGAPVDETAWYADLVVATARPE